MATNFDFGFDYSQNAAAQFENGNYLQAAAYEVGATAELVLDLGATYYGVGVLGGVIEGAKTAIVTGSLMQGYIQAERQINQFTEQYKAGIANTWNTITAPLVNGWNSATSAIANAFSYGSKGGTYTNIEEGLNFSNKAAEHMENSSRYVPVQILQDAIKQGNAFSDPQGSDAMMYYTTMYKNGKMYNLEVLYNEETNMILHFEYARKAMGNLPAIK